MMYIILSIDQLGSGTQLNKIDLKDAFRLIPISPSDWNLLGIHWKEILCTPISHLV